MNVLEMILKLLPIPGPSAVATAVSISGFSEKFIFYGFLPEKKQALSNVFNKISNFDETVCFFCIFKKSE
jgi:16S rRNA (cytidine1402-2'-O)-methyltransferase